MSRLAIPPSAEQLPLLLKGHVDLISQDELTAKLEKSFKTQTPLVIKAGFDPSAPDLHAGHTVLIRKMRHFQSFGHDVVFLIGDFTGMIGDPTGKQATRPPLPLEDFRRHAATYQPQLVTLPDPPRPPLALTSQCPSPLAPYGPLPPARPAAPPARPWPAAVWAGPRVGRCARH